MLDLDFVLTLSVLEYYKFLCTKWKFQNFLNIHRLYEEPWTKIMNLFVHN